jgi:hypothetical protein
LASTISLPEKAKKPKAVAAEAARCPPEIAKGTSATNVAEEERKMPSLPKYAAVPREVFGAGPVAVEESVAVEAVEAQGVAAEKMEEVEDEDKEDEDGDDDSASGNDVKEESGNEGSEYAPDSSDGDGTVHLSDDVDNLPDEVKPSQMKRFPVHLIFRSFPLLRPCWLSRERRGRRFLMVMSIAFSCSAMMRWRRLLH